MLCLSVKRGSVFSFYNILRRKMNVQAIIKLKSEVTSVGSIFQSETRFYGRGYKPTSFVLKYAVSYNVHNKTVNERFKGNCRLKDSLR